MIGALSNLVSKMILGGTADERAEMPWESPSVMDVLTVKAMLFKCLELPPELIDVIIDYAEYWPHTTAYTNFKGESRAIYGSRGTGEDVLLVSADHVDDVYREKCH